MAALFALDLSPSLPVLLLGAGLSVAIAILTLGLLAARQRADRFLPVPDHPAAPESGLRTRRFKIRRHGTLVQILVRVDGEEASGWVVDRSSGGLGLQLPCAVTTNAVVPVRAVAAPEETPWVEMRVRQCRQLRRTHWAVGCEFVETPPWSILLLFG
jgi:hypothetical protein